MISNSILYILCFLIVPLLLMGLLGLLLGRWIWKRGHTGDLTAEGEGALRAEADALRARVQDLEGRVSTRDTEVTDLKSKLAAAATGAAAATAATAVAAKAAPAADDDESYALEWRNRYLAARVKYLEGRLAEAPKAKKKAAPKTRVVAKKAAPKKRVVAKAKPKPKPKPKAKAKPKVKVLYTDGPTDGAPDDLKLIKGIGPKFEKDLHSKGIYYFRQIGAWKAADVKMVEGVIDSIPGRIQRDEWVKQGKVLAGGGAPRAMKAAPNIAKKKSASAKRTSTKAKSTSAAKKTSKGSGKGAGNAKYYDNVRKFDRSAKTDVIDNIVKYCGVALRTRDGSLVACSDEAEVKRVAAGFATKKLGLKSGQLDLVKGVCQDMKSQRLKNRVTFYYLAAKKAGKLGIFGG